MSMGKNTEKFAQPNGAPCPDHTPNASQVPHRLQFPNRRNWRNFTMKPESHQPIYPGFHMPPARMTVVFPGGCPASQTPAAERPPGWTGRTTGHRR